jgi:hypothetical protein
MTVQIRTSAELRARIRALRDLTANKRVVPDGTLRELVTMHVETPVRDIHNKLGSRAVLRESVRRGTLQRSALRAFVQA